MRLQIDFISTISPVRLWLLLSILLHIAHCLLSLRNTTECRCCSRIFGVCAGNLLFLPLWEKTKRATVFGKQFSVGKVLSGSTDLQSPNNRHGALLGHSLNKQLMPDTEIFAIRCLIRSAPDHNHNQIAIRSQQRQHIS